jgi:hypothetical protein
MVLSKDAQRRKAQNGEQLPIQAAMTGLQNVGETPDARRVRDRAMNATSTPTSVSTSRMTSAPAATTIPTPIGAVSTSGLPQGIQTALAGLQRVSTGGYPSAPQRQQIPMLSLQSANLPPGNLPRNLPPGVPGQGSTAWNGYTYGSSGGTASSKQLNFGPGAPAMSQSYWTPGAVWNGRQFYDTQDEAMAAAQQLAAKTGQPVFAPSPSFNAAAGRVMWGWDPNIVDAATMTNLNKRAGR